MSNGYLLDTQALLWATYKPDALTDAVIAIVSKCDMPIFVSAASAYEITLKYNLGKLDFAKDYAINFAREIAKDEYNALPLRIEHSCAAGLLPMTHRDPFDRMLIAQAKVDGLTLISNEVIFDEFEVERLW